MTTAELNGRRRSGSVATLDPFNVADCYSQSDRADFKNRSTCPQRWPHTIASPLIGRILNGCLDVPVERCFAMPLKQSTSGRTTATKSNRQHIDSTRLEAVYDDIKNSLDQFDVLELRRLIGQGMVTNIALRNAVDFQHEPVETLLVGPKLPCPTIPRSIVESERLSAEESDRIARAIDVFENKGVAAAWMQLPHVASRCTSNVLADLHFDDAKELTTKAALALTSRIASPV
ncbi:hypothetical protein [Burkholderia sp. AU16741]|uniref:hypothetical protein n=1 Tax=Burkholderia sp. AU16741 TaxID=2015347 RepID=UPI00117D3B8D|nr:hypothetical protein [Burkholderia sp. AU16741]